MTEWIAWLAALAVLSVALTWGLRREFARLEREAAYRRATAPLRAALTAFSAAIGAAMLPAMRQMVTAAIDAGEAMERLSEVLRRPPDPPEPESGGRR